MKLGIIDYGAGNLHSVQNVTKSLGYDAQLVAKAADFAGVTHIILPGVGSFGDSMAELEKRALVQPILDWIAADKPFFGICLGYQVLFEGSEESPDVAGLGVFKGSVRRFSETGLKVPHMGWNDITLIDRDAPIWAGLDSPAYLYFVHSYFPQPADEQIIAATCTYGDTFAAAVQRGNLFACQCHPEKSQSAGQTLLKNFLASAPALA